MNTFGVDYAWGRPGTAALKAAGAHFACRYLSHDTTGKNLTPAEAKQLSAAGIAIVVVWESGARRALGGHAAGVADARAAAAQAEACGMPARRPVYFAVDFDATAAQQAAIHSYLDGAAFVLGRDRIGLYAGYYVIKRAFDAHKITWGWQTYAWSGGHWDTRAQLQQYSNDHLINGVGCDYNRAIKTDYGQWRVGVSPSGKEEDMPEPKDVWNWDGIKAPPWKVKAGQKTWQPSTYMYWTYVHQAEQSARLSQLAAKLDAQQATIDKLVDAVGQAGSFDPAELKREIREAIESIQINLDVPEDATP